MSMRAELSFQGMYRHAAYIFEQAEARFGVLANEAVEKNIQRLSMQYAEHCVGQARLQADKVSFSLCAAEVEFHAG